MGASSKMDGFWGNEWKQTLFLQAVVRNKEKTSLVFRFPSSRKNKCWGRLQNWESWKLASVDTELKEVDCMLVKIQLIWSTLNFDQRSQKHHNDQIKFDFHVWIPVDRVPWKMVMLYCLLLTSFWLLSLCSTDKFFSSTLWKVKVKMFFHILEARKLTLIFQFPLLWPFLFKTQQALTIHPN